MKEKEQTSDEDSELISLCKKGDLSAFEALVNKHQKRIFNIAYRMTGDYDDACEIVQDAFVSAYRNIRNFEEKARFFTWLYAIVINLAKNRLKQLKSLSKYGCSSIDDPIATDDGEIKLELASNEPSALERLEEKDIQERVQECISRLDIEYRDIIILRDIQGFSYDEIGNMLKIPEGTVKSRLSRARENIKDCLKKIFGDL